MTDIQHRLFQWAAAGMGWQHSNAIQVEGITHFIFDGDPPPIVSLRVSPVYWDLAKTTEDRLRVVLETICDMQRICLNGGFDPRNPPRVTQEEQDLQDGTARHDEVQQDQGRSDPDPQGSFELRG